MQIPEIYFEDEREGEARTLTDRLFERIGQTSPDLSTEDRALLVSAMGEIHRLESVVHTREIELESAGQQVGELRGWRWWFNSIACALIGLTIMEIVAAFFGRGVAVGVGFALVVVLFILVRTGRDE